MATAGCSRSDRLTTLARRACSTRPPTGPGSTSPELRPAFCEPVDPCPARDVGCLNYQPRLLLEGENPARGTFVGHLATHSFSDIAPTRSAWPRRCCGGKADRCPSAPSAGTTTPM